MRQVTSLDWGEVGYNKLIAWKLADQLALGVYKFTDKLPKHELFGITSQLRRAVLSVPLNIAEGHSRNNKNEFRQFLKIALGSLAEVEYLLSFSFERGYTKKQEYEELALLKLNCGKVLWKLMKSQ